MMFEPAESGSAWYHHFWPWFIVVLLGLSVAGSLMTVAIAYQHRDVDVRILERLEASSGQQPRNVSDSSDAGSRADGR